jgi:hypothetical protein
VGERAPHAWIERSETRSGTAGPLSTLDLFEGRLTLLTGRCGHGWAVAAAEVVTDVPGGTSLDVVIVGRDIRDLGGSLQRRYRLGDAGAVLVRPDGYVAARFTGQEVDARAILGAAIGTSIAQSVAARAELRRAG